MSVVSRRGSRILDQRIMFQRKVETRSATGDVVETYVDHASAYAAIDAEKANERFANEIFKADQLITSTEYTVWVYWRDDIDATMRIVWGSKILDIRTIPDQQRRGIHLALFCRQGINEG